MNLNDMKTALIKIYPNGDVESLEQYLSICSNDDRQTSDYTEKHHILPRHKFPQYSNLKTVKWNCANLNFVNHSLAHYHFAKFCNTLAAWSALDMVGRGVSNSFRKGESTEDELIEIAKLTAIGRKESAKAFSDPERNQEWLSKVKEKIQAYRDNISTSKYRAKHIKRCIGIKVNAIKRIKKLYQYDIDEPVILYQYRYGTYNKIHREFISYIKKKIASDERARIKIAKNEQKRLLIVSNSIQRKQSRNDTKLLLDSNWKMKYDHIMSNKNKCLNMDIWNHFEDMYQLWIKSNNPITSPGRKTFARMCIDAGYPVHSYQILHKLAKQRYNESAL